MSRRLSVRIATRNSCYRNSTQRAVPGLRAILTVADVVGVQRVNTAARRNRVAHKLYGFSSPPQGQPGDDRVALPRSLDRPTAS